MERCSSVEGDEVEGVEGDVVSGVDIDGLDEPDGHPGPEENQVVAEEKDAPHEAHTKDHGLQRVSIFSDHAERSLEVVMDFVDVFVNALVVETSVKEVMPCIL